MTTDTITEHPQPSSTPTSSQGHERRWEDVHVEVRNSIVAIEIVFPFDFSLATAACNFATGFVVDCDLGIILSNRHVLGAGPGIHKATFDTNEYVYLQPVHYDPIHDFAFFRYDPAALKHTQPKAIRLFPDGARPGVPFQLIGNAAGEKMTVCAGTLSQVNRNPPIITDGYDANTFYCQASTTSTGGVSGSPLLDIGGNAIALSVAVSRYENSSFFLPLERVVYSLEYVRRGERTPRGTVQTAFLFESYQEVQRLGLPEQEIEESRLANPKSEGMIVVDKVLHKGPADGALEVGDIVIDMDGKPICDFVGLESVLDASVGCTVEFVVWRKGKLVPVTVCVQDMYDAIPTRLLHFALATLHDMPLSLALSHSSVLTGVFIAGSTTMFLPTVDKTTYRLILSVNGTPTPNLMALLDVFRSAPGGRHVVMKVANYQNTLDYVVATTSLAENMGPLRLFTRSMESGFWSVEDVEMRRKETGSNASEAALLLPTADVIPRALSGTHANLHNVWRSMVLVTSAACLPADNCSGGTASDTGFVLDRLAGIVVCSASAFHGSAANVLITIRNTLQVSATVVYVHPLYPLIFLKYDPSDLGPAADDLVSDLPVDTKYWCGESRLTVGQEITVLGTNPFMQPQVFYSRVVDRYLYEGDKSCKEHDATTYFNFDIIDVLCASNCENSSSGAICNSDGHVLGLWIQLPLCYKDHHPKVFTGVDLVHISKLAERMRSSSEYPDIVRTLNARLSRISLAEARGYGLSDRWVARILAVADCENSVFLVKQLDIPGAVEAPGVEVGDIILSVGNDPVCRIDDIAILYEKGSVDLTVLRQGQEIAVAVSTTHPCETNTRRYLYWAGLFIQEPYVSAYRSSASIPSTVFTSFYKCGSPGENVAVSSGGFITELNNEAVETIDDLIRIIRTLTVSSSEFNKAVAADRLGRRVTTVPGCDVKLKLVDIRGRVFVRKFRTDDHYMPGWHMKRGGGIDAKWVLEGF